MRAPTPAPAPTTGPGLGDPLTERELAAWRGFLRAHAAVTRDLDSELRRAQDLPLSAYEVLMLVDDAAGDRLRISQLSEATLLSVSGVSRLVDRLARAGLLAKEACEEDGRGAYAVLTPSGHGRVRAARALHRAGVRRRFLERLSEDEIDTLAAAWGRMAPDDGA